MTKLSVALLVVWLVAAPQVALGEGEGAATLVRDSTLGGGATGATSLS